MHAEFDLWLQTGGGNRTNTHSRPSSIEIRTNPVELLVPERNEVLASLQLRNHVLANSCFDAAVAPLEVRDKAEERKKMNDRAWMSVLKRVAFPCLSYASSTPCTVLIWAALLSGTELVCHRRHGMLSHHGRAAIPSSDTAPQVGRTTRSRRGKLWKLCARSEHALRENCTSLSRLFLSSQSVCYPPAMRRAALTQHAAQDRGAEGGSRRGLLREARRRGEEAGRRSERGHCARLGAEFPAG